MKSHITDKLSAYCLGELAQEESRQIAEHLIACQRCRQQYDEVKLGVAFASRLETLPAPKDLWLKFSSGLEGAPLPSARSRRVWRPLLAAAAAVLIVLILGSTWYAWRSVNLSPLIATVPETPDPRPQRPIKDLIALLVGPPIEIAPPRAYRVTGPGVGSLEVIALAGKPLVDTNVIAGKSTLAVGQWLETDHQSRAQITIADIGRVEVGSNSRISLLQTRPTEHRLNLVRGRISAAISAPPRLFIVETPTAVAVDLGCEYTIEVDESGAGVLRVTSGYVALEFSGRESIVPAGAICNTRPRLGPGTPVFEDASDAFRRALLAFDLSTGRPGALQVLLAEARRRDTLTLWHLLPQVSGSERALVFDRMVGLYAPPDDVTKAGILRLDRIMLEAYRKRLEWVW